MLLRSVAAMDQPRPWRRDTDGCDDTGKYTSDALIAELRKESESKGYNPQVTDAVINIYSRTKGIPIDDDSQSMVHRRHVILLEPI